MPKPEDVEVRFIEAVRECHKWGVAERILSYYESLYNKDPIHIYNELDLIKSGYYPRDIVKPEYINKYTLSIASIRDVLNTISGHGESNDFQKLIEFWELHCNYEYVRRCVHLCTREDLIENIIIQHNFYGEVRPREILKTIAEEPTRISQDVINMMTAIKEFTDNPKNSKSPFVTSKDCGDSMTKWLIREFRDYSISQDGMRDRVIKVLREVNKKHSDTFDIEVTYSSKWFFDNKKEIDDFVMSIFSNHIINGWLVSYD